MFNTNVFAKNSDSFNEGKNLFLHKKFDESKFFFEKDLVFNPKNSHAYYYLAKIFRLFPLYISDKIFLMQDVMYLDLIFHMDLLKYIVKI